MAFEQTHGSTSAFSFHDSVCGLWPSISHLGKLGGPITAIARLTLPKALGITGKGTVKVLIDLLS